MRAGWTIAALIAAPLLAQVPAVSERVNVRVMDLDVVVTDREGRPVADLRRDEFRVRIDRRPVPVDYFAAVYDSSVRANRSALSPDLVLQPREKTEEAAIPRHFLLFLATGDSPANRARAAESLRDFLGRLGPSDEAAVLEESGFGVVTLIEWTSDREALLAALEGARRSRAEPFRRPEGRREPAKLVRDLEESLSLFGGKPGRKVLVQVSGGLVSAPPADLQRLADRANALEVTIFGLDGAEGGALQFLTEETGGQSFPGPHRLPDAVDELLREVSTYYSLGVDLKNVPAEGTHRIEVVIDRPGLVVRARQTYSVLTEEQRVEDRVLATLLTKASYADVAVTLKTDPPTRERSAFVLPLRIEVPARDLTFLPDGDRGSARLALYFAAVNARGEQSELSHSVETLAIPLNESRSSRPMRIGLPVRLARGDYRIVVNVRDLESGRMGTARAAVRVE